MSRITRILTEDVDIYHFLQRRRSAAFVHSTKVRACVELLYPTDNQIAWKDRIDQTVWLTKEQPATVPELSALLGKHIIKMAGGRRQMILVYYDRFICAGEPARVSWRDQPSVANKSPFTWRLNNAGALRDFLFTNWCFVIVQAV